MDIYLPIAGQSVNALLIVALGLLVGILSGMFGVGGGLLGALAGAGLFRMLQASGQIDQVIASLYVLLLGSIGGLMLKDALVALGFVTLAKPSERPRHNRWIASLPLRWRF